MTPIPLRTVRPFVIEQVVLTEAAEEEGFDVSDQMAVNKFLKSRVSIITDASYAQARLSWISLGQRTN